MDYFKNLVKKVIVENAELSEQGFLKGLFAASRNITPELRAAFDDVIRFSVNKGDEIKMMAKDAAGKPKKGTAIPVTSADDLKNAIIEGRLTVKEAARVYAGLFKSGRQLPQNLLSAMVKDLIESRKFISKYAKYKPNAMRGMLQKNKYSTQAIEEIMKQAPKNPLFKAAQQKSVVKQAAKTTTAGAGGGANRPAAGQNIRNTNTNNLNLQLTLNAGQGTQALSNLGKDAKNLGDDAAEKVLNDAAQGTKDLSDGARDALNGAKKMSLKQKILYGLLIIGGGYLAIRSIFGGNTNPEDPENKILPKCILDLLDDDGVTAETTADGVVIVRVSKTGNAEYDNAGGLIFYNDGTVSYGNGSRKGKYSCKETGGESEIVYEPEAEISEMLSEVKLRFKQILNYGNISILNEAVEVTQQEMTNYVDTAVDDIDGWVDVGNLKSLKNIVTNLKGKTYKGKNALSEFLRFYSVDEGGDDFIKDVSDIGVKTLGVEGIELRDEIIAIAKTGQITNLEGGDGNTNTGIGGIDIIWDKEETPPPPKREEQPVKDEYQSCTRFPIGPGCISGYIVELQRCYGIARADGSKRIDGMFSPEFQELLKTLYQQNKINSEPNVLTEEIYKILMDKCNASQTQQPVTEPPSEQPAEQLPTIAPPQIPAEPVYDQNRLNELLASQYLVKKRNGTIVKWKGPELAGNDYYILNKYLTDQGYIQKKQREVGDKDDDDVQMKYKWKLNSAE